MSCLARSIFAEQKNTKLSGYIHTSHIQYEESDGVLFELSQ